MAALGYFVIDREETGKRIRVKREHMGLSRDGLADRLSDEGILVSLNSLGRWERGEVDICYEHAKILAKIFGCELYNELIVYYLSDPKSKAG